eukprot:CAMPEP_0184867188 /NCGR_PEP_ID=MMETSP0580-20130426/25337_1 /TAXON_ID=1118495 /ORGANISM="Dactyliosolen fragilissimus" /LENGTH=710 /DNA_ID=CAMNT_0027367289 /DNA_START=94 /DNA_END=2223 /DNA_ORIENTATION=-
MEERFSRLAGVRPSQVWLDSCRQHLQSNSHGEGTEEDAILHQILNSDLRDVVRSFESEDMTAMNDGFNGNIQNERRMSKGFQLRHSMVQSMPGVGNNTNELSGACKSILPDDFRLMVQIEELLDVSLNAEARVSVGPASPNAPTPVGNQRLRCLKMCISDGYFPNGLSQSRTTENDTLDGDHNGNQNHDLNVEHIIAMEENPIPNLSVHSRAGIKVLLRGPIVVRLGILMLHEGNATILGGCIPSYLRVQKKAREAAARLAGVGVDPTVKALIWNPHTGMEQDEDEGDHESGDVQAAQNHSQALNDTSLNTNVNPYDNHIRTYPNHTSLHNVPIDSTLQNTNQTSEGNRYQKNLPNQSNQEGVYHQHQRINNTNQVNSGPSSTSLNNTSQTNIQQRSYGNPYTKYNSVPTLASRSSFKTSNKITTPESDQETQVQAPSNTFENLSVHTPIHDENINQHKKAPTMTAQFTNENLRHANNMNIASTCNEAMNGSADSKYKNKTDDIGMGINPAVLSNDTTVSQEIGPLSTQIELSVTAMSMPLSFSELYRLLDKMINDRGADYENYFTKTFVVPCKLSSKQRDNFGFDIEKTKKQKNKNKSSAGKVDKYGYIMNVLITGTDENEGKITCKLMNDIIEPFIGISSGQMRKLAREDKARANKFVSDGGHRALCELQTLASCHLRLLHSKDEFLSLFNSKTSSNGFKIDGDIPCV